MTRFFFNLVQSLKLSTETGSLILFKAIQRQEQLTYFSWELFLVGNAASTVSHMLLFVLSYYLKVNNPNGFQNLLAGPTLILALVSYNVISQLFIKAKTSFPFIGFEIDHNLSGGNWPFLLCLVIAVTAIYFAGVFHWDA